MTETIHTPWTDEQVAALNAFQRAGAMHPFTCGALHESGQSPVLAATSAGWVCPDPRCEYTQEWAHAFMAASSAVEPSAPTETALRDRIAEAVIPLLLDTLPKVIAKARGYEIADVLLAAVLPPPADRPAEEAYRLAVSAALRLGTGATWEAIRDRAEDLTAEVAELTEARVRQLEAAAPVDRATVEEHRLALSDALGLGTGAPWDAIRDRVTELALPPLGQDPVARRLGLVAEHRATVLNEAADALDGLTQETAAADMTMPEGRWRAGLDAGIRELRRLANEERDEREAQVHLDQLVEDVCRPVVIGGEIVRVHGAAEMSDESRAALAEVTAIVKRRMAVEAQQQTETPPSIHANDVEGFCPACGHPTLRVGEDGLLTCTLMDCPNPDAANGLSYRLEAVLTERFTELGNPFSRMRIAFQGPDSWPASREVGPHDVAEVLRELQAAAVPAGTGEVPCPGFPDGCPTLIAVVPTVGSTHGGGLRCGCYDEKSTP